MLIKLTKKQRIKITKSEDIYLLINDLLKQRQKIDRDKEYFFCVGVHTNNVIKFIDLVSIGSLNGTVVCGREVFKAAILKSAAGIILIHNHPSGNRKPSESDISLTKKMVHVGKYLSINILDHIIVTTDCGYYSFADERMIDFDE